MKLAGSAQMNGFTTGMQQAKKPVYESVKKLWNDRDVQTLKGMVRQYELSGQRTDWDVIGSALGQSGQRCKEKYWRECGGAWEQAVQDRFVQEIRTAYRAGDTEINWRVMESKFNRPAGALQKHFGDICQESFTKEDDEALLRFADSTERAKPHWAEMQRALGFPAGACYQRFKTLYKRVVLPEEVLGALREQTGEALQGVATRSGVRLCFLKQKQREMREEGQ